MAFIVGKKKNLVDLSIPFDGETIELQYDKDNITPAFEDVILSCSERGRNAQMLVEYIVAMVLKWNLERYCADGKKTEPIPITVEDITPLSVRMLESIVEAVFEDNRPKDR